MSKLVLRIAVTALGAAAAATIVRLWRGNRRTATAPESEDLRRWEADGGQDLAVK